MKPRTTIGALLLTQAILGTAVIAAAGGLRLAVIATLAAGGVVLTCQRSSRALACGVLAAAAVALIAAGHANGQSPQSKLASNEKRGRVSTAVARRRSRHRLGSATDGHNAVQFGGRAPSSLISARVCWTALTEVTDAAPQALDAWKGTDRLCGPWLASCTHQDRERRFT